jgi:hypothetical protein
MESPPGMSPASNESDAGLFSGDLIVYLEAIGLQIRPTSFKQRSRIFTVSPLMTAVETYLCQRITTTR